VIDKKRQKLGGREAIGGEITGIIGEVRSGKDLTRGEAKDSRPSVMLLLIMPE
jgi:hypothetical protein